MVTHTCAVQVELMSGVRAALAAAHAKIAKEVEAAEGQASFGSSSSRTAKAAAVRDVVKGCMKVADAALTWLRRRQEGSAGKPGAWMMEAVRVAKQAEEEEDAPP